MKGTSENQDKKDINTQVTPHLKNNQDYEIFVSSEHTQYKWLRSQETIVQLTEEEVTLVKFRVNVMKDEEIQNGLSQEGVPMGIPIQLTNDRFAEIRERITEILERDPDIGLSAHAIDRLLTHGELRGWEDEEDICDCVTNARIVNGVRLSVNHNDPKNTEKVKHLHTNFAIEIIGKKKDGTGRLVLVIFNENKISVVTIL